MKMRIVGNRKGLVGLIAVAVLLACVSCSTAVLPPEDGAIKITSEPSGATIGLETPDGPLIGPIVKTPHTFDNVKPGIYTVKLYLDGYQDWSTSVEVGSSEIARVDAALISTHPATTGSISVTSSPSGANVYLDNTYKGITPITITEVSPGGYTVVVKLDGYEDSSTGVQVTAGGTASVSASLTSSPTPTPKTPTTVFCAIAALIISGIIVGTKRRGRK